MTEAAGRTHAIGPLSPTDAELGELSRFLTEGFGAAADAPFAAVDVLRWKYFDPRGDEAGTAPRSYLARDEASGRVVGHLGVCPARWHGPGVPAEGVSTLHMIDWLSSQAAAGVGARLMRRAHQEVDTQYGLGGSAAGRGVGGRGGYALQRMVPVYQRVLRPTHRLRVPGGSSAGRWLRAGKDALGRLRTRPRRPSVAVSLRPVERFGPEAAPMLDALAARAVFTTREPELLNHLLRYPRGGLTGWHVARADAEEASVCGLGVLAVVPQPGGVRVGRVVECLVAPDDPALWHAVALALTDALAAQGADLAQAFASTDRAADAWRAAGYAPAHALEFRLRDRSNRLPPGAAFHLTPVEADYAYV